MIRVPLISIRNWMHSLNLRGGSMEKSTEGVTSENAVEATAPPAEPDASRCEEQETQTDGLRESSDAGPCTAQFESLLPFLARLRDAVQKASDQRTLRTGGDDVAPCGVDATRSFGCGAPWPSGSDELFPWHPVELPSPISPRPPLWNVGTRRLPSNGFRKLPQTVQKSDYDVMASVISNLVANCVQFESAVDAGHDHGD